MKDTPAARRALIVVGLVGLLIALVLALWPRVAGGWAP